MDYCNYNEYSQGYHCLESFQYRLKDLELSLVFYVPSLEKTKKNPILIFNYNNKKDIKFIGISAIT